MSEYNPEKFKGDIKHINTLKDENIIENITSAIRNRIDVERIIYENIISDLEVCKPEEIPGLIKKYKNKLKKLSE